MLRVGLTGNIGVGKSFVASVLSDLGCHIIDADQIAREVVAPDTPGLGAVVEHFGKRILQSNGALDRAQLGEIVFSDPEKRALLNSILHPLIIEAQNRQVEQWKAVDPTGICVVDAALMVESGQYRRFPVIIVVWCRPDLQLERVVARNNLTRAEAERRIASQMPQEEKKQYGTFLVNTSDGFEAARRQTEVVYAALCDTANARQSRAPAP